MTLDQIFEYNIKRAIETVVKADDKAHALQEVKEYVVTNDISNKLSAFFEEYLDYQGANGVWISGFFGSGKSHLLKILSYILQNEEVNGQHLGEILLPKIGDSLLKANIERAFRIPSKSILFNIDQKSDTISKDQNDAVLSVFYKVFNELRGYYGKQGFVANIERDLDKKGLFEPFKQKYQEVAAETWEDGRESLFLASESFAEAFSAVSSVSHDEALKVIDRYESNYSLSVEDFANEVKEYLSRQTKGFRLNFFVDEIGQYIANNNKLMLNLQTIAETLATKTQGQSWVIVTSQDEIDSVIGDMTASQSNDFSKIHARFKTKLNLTSANVDEVIQKRLLVKNSDGHRQLSALFDKHHNNFDTLFQFHDGGTSYPTFKELHDFEISFPFFPLHFGLFQQCIRDLSRHNAFMGRHASVGERSMLGVFQEVCIRLSNQEVGKLVTFDLLFDGLSSTLKSEVQAMITTAKRYLSDNPLAIRILKGLFMVKYVKTFKPTARNISILFIDSLTIDLKKHYKEVIEALNELEHQTYIQRNGDLYEFLTDEEKDIENEIKNTDLGSPEIRKFISSTIFDEIIRDNSIRFEDNKQSYVFAKKLDDNLLGRDLDLKINLITPLYDAHGNDQMLSAQSFGKAELFIILPNEDRLIDDIRLALKTDKYITHNTGSAQTQSIQRSIADKGQQNAERKRALRLRLEHLLGSADLFLNGEKLNILSSKATSRVITGFQDLIKYTYPQLKLLTRQFTENDLATIMYAKQEDLFKGAEISISPAENELITFITRNKARSERTTAKALLENFKARPFGWPEFAILGLTANLFKRGKVEIKQDSNILDNKEALEVLKNNRHHANTIIELQETFSDAAVRNLKTLYQDFFNEANPGTDAKEVATYFKVKLKEEITLLKQLLQQSSRYSFLKNIQDPLAALETLQQKEYVYFLNAQDKFSAELLDAKDDILDPIKSFMNGAKKDIYDNLLMFLDRDNANFTYIDGEELPKLKEIRTNATPYKGNTMQTAKTLLDQLGLKITTKINEEREKAIHDLDNMINKLSTFEEYQSLSAADAEKVIAPFLEEKKNVTHERFIGNIRSKIQHISDQVYQKALALMTTLANPAPVPTYSDDDNEKPETRAAEPAHITYINKNSIKLDYKKPYIETEQDLEEFVEALKTKYSTYIKGNKRITI